MGVAQSIRKALSPEPPTIIVTGMYAAGKTTLLYKLASNVETTIPTIGFQVEKATTKRATYLGWDAGGRCPVRPLWRHYTQASDGIVFVVNSAALSVWYPSYFDEVSAELTRLLDMCDKHMPIAVLANQQDLPEALSVDALTEALHLSKVLEGRPWAIFPTAIAKDEGYEKPLLWLQDAILSKKSASVIDKVVTTSPLSKSKGAHSPPPYAAMDKSPARGVTSSADNTLNASTAKS
eukprot:m.168433 g.168433  ORF g.168433 m.168433 type:complete len:236 (+) comp14476_c0_seq1:204-911(+)